MLLILYIFLLFILPFKRFLSGLEKRPEFNPKTGVQDSVRWSVVKFVGVYIREFGICPNSPKKIEKISFHKEEMLFIDFVILDRGRNGTASCS